MKVVLDKPRCRVWRQRKTDTNVKIVPTKTLGKRPLRD